MTDITQCPHCGTHFNITLEQEKAHQGQVRCGQCETVFNAIEHLYTAPLQLDLPIPQEDIEDATSMFEAPSTQGAHINPVSISPEAAARQANDFSHIPDIYVTESDHPQSRQRTGIWIVGTVTVGLVSYPINLFFSSRYRRPAAGC
jgi:predicted Zn finger-like uncharacterized protein